MYRVITTCALVTSLTVLSVNLTEIPSFMNVCRRSDPKLNECVKKAVEALRPHLITGIPEFGIPSIEPIELDELVINQGSGAVSVTSTYTDIKVYGSSKFQLDSVKLDLENSRVRIKLWLPYLYMTSNYNIDGRILMMPIMGSGYSKGNYTDIEATCNMQGEHVRLNGTTYFSVKNFDIKFNIGDAHVYLSDLFNGDKELGEAMNTFLNDNWKNVAVEIKPVLERKIGELLRKFSNNIYHRIPLNQLLVP